MRLLLLMLALGCAACAANVAQPAGSAGVPSMSEARTICRAVAEGRAEFLDVVTGPEDREEPEWTSVDVDNDGTPEDVAILIDSESNRPGINVRPGGAVTFIESNYNEAGRSLGPFDLGGQLLLTRRNGRIYEVFYTDSETRDYPDYVAVHLPGGESHWLCSIQATAPPPRLTPSHDDVAGLCAAVEQRRTVDEDVEPGPFEDEDFEDGYYVGPDHLVRAEGAVDFMNNGQPRELLRVLHADEAGCETEFLALAEGFEPYSEPAGPEAIALSELQSERRGRGNYVHIANGYACDGNIARFHNIGGSVVFEQRFPGERPQRRAHEFWWVSRVENGEAVRLCEATAFDPRPRAIAYNPILYPNAR